MSQSAPSLRASSSLFFFSPLLTRQFSNNTTSPGATVTPSTQLEIRGTRRPSNSLKRSATGASESSGLNSPSVGRPRCEVTITAAPTSRAMRIAGTLARMRVSSVMFPSSSCGTLRSARMKTRLPLAEPLAHKSEKRMTFMVSEGCEGQNLILKVWPLHRLTPRTAHHHGTSRHHITAPNCHGTNSF